MSREPDDTPVTREHVKTFLGWYGARVKLHTFPGYETEWLHAFKGLTLGQLRSGMRAYQRFTTQPHLNPPQFHGLCTGLASEAQINAFNKMRETLRKGGKIKVAPEFAPTHRRGESPGKPGTSHD